MSTIENMEKITGIKRNQMQEIFDQVKGNSKKLRECVRPHDFSICLDRHTKHPIDNPTDAQKIFARWRCAKCGGDVDGQHKRSYEEGMKDAQ